MIGNDLVDLELAAVDSNWQRKGYLEKICTAAEQKLILTAAAPADLIWLIWTMKEAAYKAENRLSGRRFYAPADFITSVYPGAANGFSGQVCYRDRVFFTRTTVDNRMIHSIACLETSAFSHIQTRYLSNTPGYAGEFNARQEDYRLEKNKSGIPVLACRENGRYYAASVSHHGAYLAVIYSGSLLSAD